MQGLYSPYSWSVVWEIGVGVAIGLFLGASSALLWLYYRDAKRVSRIARSQKNSIRWETLGSQGAASAVITYRAKVPGGWLVHIVDGAPYAGQDFAFFYPDDGHEWQP